MKNIFKTIRSRIIDLAIMTGFAALAWNIASPSNNDHVDLEKVLNGDLSRDEVVRIISDPNMLLDLKNQIVTFNHEKLIITTDGREGGTLRVEITPTDIKAIDKNGQTYHLNEHNPSQAFTEVVGDVIRIDTNQNNPTNFKDLVSRNPETIAAVIYDTAEIDSTVAQALISNALEGTPKPLPIHFRDTDTIECEVVESMILEPNSPVNNTTNVSITNYEDTEALHFFLKQPNNTIEPTAEFVTRSQRLNPEPSLTYNPESGFTSGEDSYIVFNSVEGINETALEELTQACKEG